MPTGSLPNDDAGGDPMTDPIADLIGDYRAFTALQRERLGGWSRSRKPADQSEF